jgi:hypothetical protein
MVSPAANARPRVVPLTPYRTGLRRTRLCFLGNGNFGGETNRRKTPLRPKYAVARFVAEKKARQLPAFLVCSGNLRSHASVWWAREDSNLQPSGYERDSLWRHGTQSVNHSRRNAEFLRFSSVLTDKEIASSLSVGISQRLAHAASRTCTAEISEVLSLYLQVWARRSHGRLIPAHVRRSRRAPFLRCRFGILQP